GRASVALPPNAEVLTTSARSIAAKGRRHRESLHGSPRSPLMVVTPALACVITVVHPFLPFNGRGVLEFLRPRLDLWMVIHRVQLPLVGLLGMVIRFLTEGPTGRAATVRRLAVVAKRRHLLRPLGDQRGKCGVVDVGAGRRPTHHQTQAVQHDEQLGPHDPAMVGQPFASGGDRGGVHEAPDTMAAATGGRQNGLVGVFT
ncbi:MAG: hypothetical protein NTZ05_12965, partial [Chloroflexi bacterium]|nr:hypothetical protein [Chloroflexota bacterium]